MAVAQELYVDPSFPDGGSGTFANPYSRQDLAVSALSGNESIIYLKKGFVYQAFGTQIAPLYISGKSPSRSITVKSYGTSGIKPTLFSGTNMVSGDSGWSYVGLGVWKKAMESNSGYNQNPYSMRLYKNSFFTGPISNRELGTNYNIGVALARCNVANNATENEIMASINSVGGTGIPRLWMYTTDSSGYLYVYTGTSMADPPTYYRGLTLVGANNLYDDTGFGRIYGAFIYNSSRIRIQDIDSIYAPFSLKISCQAFPSTNCTFTNCNAYAFGFSGLTFDGTATNSVVSAVATNCIIDSVATPEEEYDTNQDGGIIWINGAQDAAIIGPYTTSCVFDSCTVIDGCHNNTLIGTHDGSKDGFTLDAKIINHTAKNPNRNYGTLLNCVGLGTGNVANVYRFNGTNNVAYISRTGSGKLNIYDSYFGELKAPYPSYDYTNGSGKINAIPGINIYKNTSFGNIEAGCVSIFNSTIQNPYGFMLSIVEFGTAGAIPTGSVIFNNSVFIDTLNINNIDSRTFNHSLYNKPGITWDMRDSSQPNVVSVTNCYYYTGSSNQPRVATSNTISSTFAAYTGLTGSFIENDPGLNDTGKQITGAAVKSTGTHLKYTRDVTGVQRPNPPSIGAYEYVTNRSSASTRGTAQVPRSTR